MEVPNMSSVNTTKAWNIDVAHSSVAFSVRHMVISKVRGRFAKFSGRLELNDQDLTQSAVDIHIDASSIDTGVVERDGHLRSPDFFDVEKFPELTFKSKRVERLGEDRYRVIGDLTIRGTSREVPLEVEAGGRVKDPWGNNRAGFTARTKIDRREFGLEWNNVIETGGLVVGDHVDIDIDVEGVQAAEQNAA
jgi:polyisoprenoid-binding protein YceI